MQDGQQHLIEPPSQYEKLKRKGMMEWYDKAKAKQKSCKRKAHNVRQNAVQNDQPMLN